VPDHHRAARFGRRAWPPAAVVGSDRDAKSVNAGMTYGRSCGGEHLSEEPFLPLEFATALRY